MKIIDSHVHFPSTDHPDVWRSMAEAAARNGIGRLVVSNVFCGGAYPTQENLHAGNRFCLEAARRSGGRLAPLVYLSPQLPDWERELDEARQAGAVGAKLWISLKDEHGSLANTVRVLRACESRRFPVLIHVFERTGGNLPGEITMHELCCLAEQAPDCTVIAAHSGGNLQAALPAIRQCPPNVSFDISGSAPFNHMLAQLLSAVPPSRVLYGSDAMGRGFAMQLLKIFACDLSDTDREDILWRNAATIYGLPEPPDLPCPAASWHAPERDFCLFAGLWPYGRFDGLAPAALDALLAREHVREAWAPSLEAALADHTQEANLAYLAACQGLERLRPLAVLNPAHGDWRHDVSQIAANGGFAGIWLSPFLHGYAPADEALHEALRECAARQLPVFLNVNLTEYRFRPPNVNWREVSPAELQQLLAVLPANTYVLQGAAYLDCPLPAGVRLHWVSSRTADSRNTPEEYPALPPNVSWVQGSEFPFRSLQGCMEQLPPGAGLGI